MLEWVTKRLEIKTSDPDEQRRAKLLNILLSGIFVLAVLALLFSFVLQISGLPLPVDFNLIFFPASALLIVIAFLFAINRYVSPSAASFLFIISLTVILYLSAPSYETVWGRNMIMLVPSIVMGSVLLRPAASFMVAGLVGVFFIISSAQNEFALNYIGILAYFAIALVAWLSASTLERALGELRVINTELDAIVNERTRELVLANAKLTEARDTAIEASKYKSELTARVSHELRTPLGAILGYSEMLRGEHYGPVNSNQKGKLTSIIEMTRNLSNLIGDWLDQAKLESGKLNLNSDWFEIRQMLDYVQGITEVMIKGRPIALSFKVDNAVPVQLYGDGDRIQQILINLVSNAIKYTDRGTVTTSVFLSDDNHWVMEVKDTGIGIPEQALPTIFDSFSQVDGSRTRVHEGFGLGLSIVNHLTDLMGGNIEVESKIGVGSVFRVILPLQEHLELA